MAEIETTIDRDRDLTVRTVRGEVTARELRDALATYYAGEPTGNILWDFSEAMVEQLTAGEVREIAKETVQYARRRVGGRTAMVFSSASAFGMGRMFDLSCNLEGGPVLHVSFHDRATALEWLGGG